MANLLCQILIWKKYDGSSLSLRCNFCPKKSKSTRINEYGGQKTRVKFSLKKNQKKSANKTALKTNIIPLLKKKEQDLLEAISAIREILKMVSKSRWSIKLETRY